MSAVEREVRSYVLSGRWSDRVVLERAYYALVYGSSGAGEAPDQSLWLSTTNALPYGRMSLSTSQSAAAVSRGDYHVRVASSNVRSGLLWDVGDRERSHCEWAGVTCSKSGDVVKVVANEASLSGTLPASLGSLSPTPSRNGSSVSARRRRAIALVRLAQRLAAGPREPACHRHLAEMRHHALTAKAQDKDDPEQNPERVIDGHGEASQRHHQ